MARFIKFYLDGRPYGIDIAPAREILLADETQVYKIPNSPKFMAGIINLRGALAPLVDLRQKLNIHAGPITSKSRILILQAKNGAVVGALVDELAHLLDGETSQINPSQANEHKDEATRGTLYAAEEKISIIDMDHTLFGKD